MLLRLAPLITSDTQLTLGTFPRGCVALAGLELKPDVGQRRWYLGAGHLISQHWEVGAIRLRPTARLIGALAVKAPSKFRDR